jgi:hypothetical protein
MGDPRISARTGGIVNLNVTFYRDGVPFNPCRIRHIDIYEGCEKPENLVASIPIDPGSGYPSPLVQVVDTSVVNHNPTGPCGSAPIGPCGTDPVAPPPIVYKTGEFILPFFVPTTFRAPQAYVDVWRFISDDCGSSLGTEPAEINESEMGDEDEDEDGDHHQDPEVPENWQSVSNKFYVFQDGIFADDGLVVPRIGFEALDKLFKKPEVRTLEVGMMPLPLYDFDFNRIAPLIPRLRATILIETDAFEILVNNEPCRIGIRQGTYRANPFTIQYTLDTNRFLVGTYQYRITLFLPNGETRVSDPFRVTIY